MTVQIIDISGRATLFQDAKVDLITGSGVLVVHDFKLNRKHTYILSNLICYTTEGKPSSKLKKGDTDSV